MPTGMALPAGEVALFFSDIEGSTALLREIGEDYGHVLDVHDAMMRAAFETYGGVEVKNEGDAFFAAFADHRAAVLAADSVQRRFGEYDWPAGMPVRVRIGLHAGRPVVRGDDYWGIDVHYAARVGAAAHGGQTLLSALMRRRVPEAEVVTLGEHALKDFSAHRELFHLVVDGRGPEHFPPPRTLSVVRNNLPSISTPMFGRDALVAEIVARLRGPERLITLVGPGGMGKTRTAVAVGEAMSAGAAGAAGSRGIVTFVPLGSVDAAASLPEVISDAVGAPRGDDAEATLTAFVRRHPLLLVVDNAEHLPDVSGLIGRLLVECPGLACLVTSQAPLRLREERVVRMEALDDSAAVAMFLDRSSGPVGDAAALLELCRLLDNVPLAIELAAARAGLAGVDPLRSLVAVDPVRALGRGPTDLPARQRGLEAVLAWTTGLLADGERAVLAGLGAFAEAWDLDQALALFADTADLDVWEVLTRLTDLALVVRRGDGRFTMPERVRRHACELLAARDEESTRRRRHAELMSVQARRNSIDLMLDHRRGMADGGDALAEMTQAMSWAEQSAPSVLASLVAHTHLLRSILEVSWSGPALDELAAAADDPGVAGLLHSIVALGAETAAARERAADRALRVVPAGSAEEMMVLYRLSHAFARAGDDDRLETLLDLGVRQAARMADRRWTWAFDGLRWTLTASRAGYAEARPELERILADRARTDFDTCWVPSFLGDCALGLGRPQEALDWFTRQITELHPMEWGNILTLLYGVAAAAATLGADETAVEIYAAACAQPRIRDRNNDEILGAYVQLVQPAIERLDAHADDVRRRAQEWDIETAVARAHALATHRPVAVRA